MRPLFRFDVYTERLEGLKYEGSTTAVSEAKAINNVRYNTRGLYESQYTGWPWSAVNKGPATEEDKQMNMINQAEEQKKEEKNTFVEVDFVRLMGAARRRRLKMKDINKWLDRNPSYCSQRRKYGTLSLWDVATIVERGIPFEEFCVKDAEPEDKEQEVADLSVPRVIEEPECDGEYITVKVDDDLRAFAHVLGENLNTFIEYAVCQRIERLQKALEEVRA